MINENNNLKINLIDYDANCNIPSSYKLKKWARFAYLKKQKNSVNIKVAMKMEMRNLSKRYLKRKNVCNALSFQNTSIPRENKLGEIIVCADVINEESSKYKISLDKRWCHMIIHSMLHLQGFNHKVKDAKLKMERKEILLMKKLGFSNPYLI